MSYRIKNVVTQMITKVSRSTEVQQLIRARSELWHRANVEIIDILSPTVIAALRRALAATPEQFEWIDIQIVDGVLLLIFTFSIGDTVNMSPLIQHLPEESRRSSELSMHLSIPIDRLDDTSDQIYQYLIDTFSEAHDIPPAELVHQEQTTYHTLTPEQVAQSVYFLPFTKGKIQ